MNFVVILSLRILQRSDSCFTRRSGI